MLSQKKLKCFYFSLVKIFIKLYPQKNVENLLILTLNSSCVIKIFLHLLCNTTEMNSLFAFFSFEIAIKFEIKI
ncbi:hypothetical protein AC804_14455 [Chryseobacterium sp. Hurlbut01]|nr:hypothetical protein AC804_14455 [Chryseobacterium sp. Hurlbut01]